MGISGFYVCYADISDVSQIKSGSARKIFDQITTIREAGISCEPLYCEQPSTLLSLVKSCLPGLPDGVQWPHVDEVADADFLYIRRPRITSQQLLDFMGAYKKANPRGIILYEMPTYPHDKEMMNPKMYLALLKDRRFRKHLHDHVDRIVDLSGTPEIFGAPTIQIRNGIDFNRVRPRKPNADIKGRINIASAAFYYKTHAVDRALTGLHEYYAKGGTRDICLWIAGDGEELGFYKRLAQAPELAGHVEFLGLLDAEQLDKLYDQCSLGLGTLGLHRIGLPTTSALKTREYLAKGLPFIYGGGVDVFDDDPVDFCLKVPSDETPVDFNEVVKFHDHLYGDRSQEEVISRVRSYGRDHVAMNAVMKNVTDYLKAHAGTSPTE